MILTNPKVLPCRSSLRLMGQLLEELTNIHNEGSSCINLLITDQPNFFVNYGVHPSLDERCQHQLIYGKLNVPLPSPPPYRGGSWDYSKAEVQSIRDAITTIG